MTFKHLSHFSCSKKEEAKKHFSYCGIYKANKLFHVQGAGPRVTDVTCNGTRPPEITKEVMSELVKVCDMVEEIEKKTGVICEISRSYKYGAIHKSVCCS